jgi:hypothetical protein
MAVTTLATELQVQKWLKSYFAEYVRTSGFLPYMGRGSNSVIQTRYELTSGGKSVNIPLVTRLKGAAVTGIAALEGSEEALGNFNQRIDIDFLRKAVRITVPDEHYSEISLMDAARDMLTTWASDTLRADIITALGSIDGLAYGAASAAQRNTWSTNNVDRVLYGNAKGNFTLAGANTHALRLANIAAGQTLTAGVVSLMKRIAKTADPFIRPMRTNDGSGREYFVMFAGSFAFRDLKNDSTMSTANREARPRDVESNPIFQDGDLIYDGVIIREIPEIPAIGTVGASSARVEPIYLCGAQAIGLAWGQEPRRVTDEFDYGHQKGIGTVEARGIQKMRFGTGALGALKDHGMVTGYIAAAGDA